MDVHDRKLFIQIIGQVLIADGVLTDVERDYIDRVMDSLGLKGDERSGALTGISMDSPVEERIAGLSAEARGMLLAEVDKAVGADGEISKGEQAILDQIRPLVG